MEDIAMELYDFFLRKWEDKFFPTFLESPSTFDYSAAQEYVTEIIAIPYDKFLDFICNDPISPCVLSSDIPQFSSIDSATTTICEVLSENPGASYRFEQIGALLQPQKQRDIISDKKYGENHVKTATELSLCAKSKGLYYLTPLGMIYKTLSDYQKDQFISRLVLRNTFVYSTIHKVLNGIDVKVTDEISFLSESTVKRRKNNCLIFCRMITKNRDLNVDNLIAKIE